MSTMTATPQSDIKWEEAVLKIADLTRRGRIKWNAVDVSDVPSYGYSTRTMAAYDAAYAGKKLRLIETAFLPRTSPAYITGPASGPNEAIGENIIGTGASLRMIDDYGAALFVFPASEAINQLLSLIKSQMADVDGFLQALYSENNA